MPGLPRKPVRYGIAVAADRVVALSEDAERQRAWSHDLSAPSVPGEWPDLVVAIERFRESAGDEPAIVAVALMPSLVQVRPVELPFLRKGELLPVLQRDAARFFFKAREEQVVAIRHLHRTRGRRTVLAAVAPRWLIELLVTRFASSALRLHQIVPAYAAWAFAANATAPARGWLGVQWDGILELLELRRGDVRQVRRVRGAGDDAMVGNITGSLPSDLAFVTKHETAIEVAARYAGRTRSLALVAPSVAAADLRRAWRQVRWLLTAAAALLVASSVLRVVDVNRELAHVRATREGLANEAGRALQVRSSVSRVERLVTQLCEIREKTPRWSDAIVTVATHLPLDAHVLRLSSAGDSVTLEGATKRASEVLEQLRDAPGIMSLHASAPIRLETNSGEDPTEYFAVVLRVDPRTKPARRP